MEHLAEERLKYKICNSLLSITAPGIIKVKQSNTKHAKEEETSHQNIMLQFESEEETISASKDLLRQRVPYFNAMFSNNFQESTQAIINLGATADVDSASKLIQFISKGSLTVCIDDVQGVIVQADIWGLEGVKNVCAYFMLTEMNSSNCLEFLEFGEMYTCGKLTQKCQQLIGQELQIVVQTHAFLDMSSTTLISILQLETLNTRLEGEDCLIKAVMKWYYHDKETREASLTNVFKHVRCQYVSQDLLHTTMTELPETVVKGIKSGLESENVPDVRRYKQRFMICCGYSQSRTGPTCPRINSLELFDPDDGKFHSTTLAEGPSFGVALNLFGRVVFFATYVHTEESLALRKKTHRSEVFSYIPCIGRNGDWVSSPEMFSAEAKECISECLIKGESVVHCPESNCIYAVEVGRCVCLRVSCSDGVIYCDYERELPNLLPFLDATHRELQAVCHQGRLYALGGFRGPLYERVFSNEVFMLSEDQMKWEPKCCMLIPRTGFAVASYRNKLIVSGGYGGIEKLRRHQSCESYDPVSDTWQEFAPMQQSRSGHCTIVANGALYVLGGKTYASQKHNNDGGWHPGGARVVSDCVEFYEEACKEWLRIAIMPKARCLFNTVVV